MPYYKEFVTGKNEKGIQKLNDCNYEFPDDDILLLDITEQEWDFIDCNIALWAAETFGITFCDYEYDEIPNELVDVFLEKLGDDKDKAPCFYEALTTAKKAGGLIQICF